MAQVMEPPEDPNTYLLWQLMAVAESAFDSVSHFAMEEDAIRELLVGMFKLLAEANEEKKLDDLLRHLREHGNLGKWLAENRDYIVPGRPVRSEASRGVLDRVRDKWFPNLPEFRGGPKAGP